MRENKFGTNILTFRDVIIRGSELGDNVIVGDDAFVSGSKVEADVLVERRTMLFNSEIGAHTSIGWNTVVRNTSVGKYCSIAWNCSIGGAEHPLHKLSTSLFPVEKSYGIIGEDCSEPEDELYAKALEIGNDVWLAAGVQVLRGVTIGSGAVVGGGATVTKSVPPYEIWAGVPARKIGQRFSDKVISELLRINWWNLPEDVIKENIDLFRRDIDDGLLKELKSRLSHLL